MAKIVDTPLDNLYIQGDGLVTKKELRDVLAKAHITNVEPETNAILEVFVVDEINSDDVPEYVRGRFVYSQNDDEELRLFRPMNSNIIQYPLVGEEWLGFTYKDVHYYLSRLSDSNVSINYKKDGINQRLVSPFTNNKDVKDNFADRELKPYGKTFVDLAPLSPPYEEGKTLLQGRFGNYIQLSSNQPSSPNSPNVRIAADNKTFISLTTDEPEPTYPVGIDFETYEPYGGEQIFLNSNRITLNAKKNKVGIYSNDDIIVSGSNDVNIFGKNNISITNNSGDGDIRIGNAKAQDLTIVSQRQRIISLRKTVINSSNGEIEIGLGRRDNPLPPAVLGNKDFIKLMDLILSTNISSKSVELATEAAQPTPNPITIESLTKEIADLKNIKDERTYLSKKVSIE